jgi:hypothetical protein
MSAEHQLSIHTEPALCIKYARVEQERQMPAFYSGFRSRFWSLTGPPFRSGGWRVGADCAAVVGDTGTPLAVRTGLGSFHLPGLTSATPRLARAVGPNPRLASIDRISLSNARSSERATRTGHHRRPHPGALLERLPQESEHDHVRLGQPPHPFLEDTLEHDLGLEDDLGGVDRVDGRQGRRQTAFPRGAEPAFLLNRLRRTSHQSPTPTAESRKKPCNFAAVCADVPVLRTTFSTPAPGDIPPLPA